MEDALDAPAVAASTASRIGDIGFDDLQPRIAGVLLEIGAAADDETVEHPDRPAFGKQTIDEVAADKAAAACHKVDPRRTLHAPPPGNGTDAFMRAKVVNFKPRNASTRVEFDFPA